MGNLIDPLWWLPRFEFFGRFYQIGDFSLSGFNSTMMLSNEQRTEKEINFILKYLSPKPGANILDCPCGYGRHSIELLKKGFRVTGVDVNDYFLSQCIEKAKKFGLSENCSFVQQSMLDLNVGLNSFEYIINLFTSFGFFDDDSNNRKVLENFYAALTSGGKLLLHFDYNATRIINKKYFKGDEHKRRECVFDGKQYDLFVHEIYNREKKRLEGSWKLRNGTPPDPVEKYYSIRIYSNKEIEKILYSVGFEKVEFYDPDNEKFTDDSRETIIIATK